MAGEHDRQGTGRHPHKDTEEPYPHTKDEGRHGSEHHARSEHRGHESSGEHRGRSENQEHRSGGSHAEHRSEEADLKRREYRDEKGEVHHHTRTYEEQHGKK
ncbi:MAG TPA: hypothetical protein VJ770_02475 [Stellaceae bacterium]|jgi:hypothetical protein|nr:hypothetical protein [Stellaceae bacterium]